MALNRVEKTVYSEDKCRLVRDENMTLYKKIALLTNKGRKKAYNEDFTDFYEPDDPHVLGKSGSIYIVADGVGRSSRGDLASRYAVKSLMYEYYRNPETKITSRLEKFITQAGNEINKHAEESDNYRRMATTLVAAVIQGDSLTVANVGDSRAYLLRDGKIQQLSEDHSLVEEMVRNGTLTPEEAKKSSLKNQITRSLGGERDVKVDVFQNISLKPGDRVLLCSDGLTRYASDEDLVKFMGKGFPDQIVKRMINYANLKGGVDNISALMVEIGEPLENMAPVGTIKALPPAVSWKSLEEQLIEPVGAAPGREENRKKVLISALSGAVVLVLLGVLYFTPFGSRLLSGGSLPTAVVYENTKPATEEALTPTAETPSPTALPTEIPVEPTPSITKEMPALPQVAPCLVHYQQPNPSTNSLFLLLRDALQKEISYQGFIEEYSLLVSCLEEIGNQCAYDPAAYEWVEAGWILELPEINSEHCLAAGGTVILPDGAKITPTPMQ